MKEPEPPSPEELASAEELRRALEGEALASEEAKVAALISAPAAAPLDELAARRLVRGALTEVERKRRRPPWGWAVAALAAAAAMLLLIRGVPSSAPERLRSRSAGLLVPGPFPAGQTAAQRLDLVTTDRLIAFRESSLYGARR